ncbi:hypothetical protein [Aestuariivita boseongensis]|uniref:hypothetical protein n=1 Tax=Aestuariivita boseongensis TaxID=1470562 RepID=UPI0006810CFD|nr:hypothetical protein [Aestuariivita boseongensis]
MNKIVKLTALTAALGALAACVETSQPANDGLSGTEAQFNAMTAPCIDQAAVYADFPAMDINILDRLRTGGGPLLVLDAGGQRLSCRLESDGSVTVFSEFAN